MNVMNFQHIQKESFEALITRQRSIAWYGYCPMKDQFEMYSMYVGTLLQAHLLCLSCRRDTLCVVEVVVVHLVQLYFVNALKTNKHPMPSNPFELAVTSLFHSSAYNPLNNFWSFKFASSDELQLLVIFSFWWTSLRWHVITPGALCL